MPLWDLFKREPTMERPETWGTICDFNSGLCLERKSLYIGFGLDFGISAVRWAERGAWSLIDLWSPVLQKTQLLPIRIAPSLPSAEILYFSILSGLPSRFAFGRPKSHLNLWLFRCSDLCWHRKRCGSLWWLMHNFLASYSFTGDL